MPASRSPLPRCHLEGTAAARGFIVEATIAKGVVSDIDATAAERATGVLRVMTCKNAPKQRAWGPLEDKDRYACASPQLDTNRVQHYGQAVAFVVAESVEQARSAARLIKINYRADPGEYELEANLAKAEKPRDQPDQPTDSVVGNFGGKLPARGDVMLSTMALRELKRPVKTGLTRQQVFHSTTRCSDTIQRVWLGASVDGKLTAIGHDTWSHSARFDDFYVNASMQTRSIYVAPNRLTTHRSVGLDLPVSDSASAPGEAVGMLLLEGAMDELALRLRNEPPVDPELIVPYSSRQLAAYLREGAKRFGSERRHAKHDTQAEGRWLIGIGVAAATRGNLLMPSSCSVSLDKQGVLTMRMAMTDISPGSYTVFTQIAAELLGLRMDQVRMQPGDSDTPPTPGSGGSCGAANAESGLYDGRINLPDKLIAKLGITSSEASFSNGRIAGSGRSDSLGSPEGTMGIAASGEIKPGELKIKYSQLAYGAHFSGVAIDRGTGEIRLPRMLGVFAAGRIFNEKTGRARRWAQ